MNKAEMMLQDIEKNGIGARGRGEMVKHLNGERLTSRQMILAKCYDCMGFYSDGRGQDCEVDTCSLYPIMPYRQKGEKYSTKPSSRKGIPLSEEQKAKMMAGRIAKNAK